ncbi:MAG: hypothetical protein P9F75_05390 [Candidatus Contendobacter sp.]|nr:hypothetical protein [Candidatus Contendobacter sp.]
MMWVWRLASEVAPGNACLYLPPRPGPYDQAAFQCQLLQNHQQLTQGWGFPTEDLNLPPARWKQNYIDIENPFDPNNPTQILPAFLAAVNACNNKLLQDQQIPTWTRQEAQTEAEKNYGLMSRFLKIHIGDTIFIPNANLNGHSDDHFMVVTVATGYQFINRSNQQYALMRRWPTDFHWTEDFGHVITVDRELTRVFRKNQLQPGAFRAPFLARIVPVVPDSEYRGFGAFLRANNYPFNPY